MIRVGDEVLTLIAFKQQLNIDVARVGLKLTVSSVTRHPFLNIHVKCRTFNFVTSGFEVAAMRRKVSESARKDFRKVGLQGFPLGQRAGNHVGFSS